MNELFAEVIRNPRPGSSYSSEEPALARALVTEVDQLSEPDLAQVVSAMAEHRPFALVRAFRRSELAAARPLLLAIWDAPGYHFWTFIFFREAIRRERAIAASALWEDLSKSTNIPGVRKRLKDIVKRHRVDSAMAGAIAAAVQMPSNPNSSYVDGGFQRYALCAWLAAEGTPACLDSIRAFGQDSRHSARGLQHIAEITREFAGTSDATGLAEEISAWAAAR